MYDSYRTSPEERMEVLPRSKGQGGLRGGVWDAFFVGLWVEAAHGPDLVEGSFDAFYTYFATDGFSHGR